MSIASLLRTAVPKKAITGAIAIAVTLGCGNLSYAAPTNRDIAWQIFERLTGTPPSNAMLDTMTDCITNGTSSSICQNGTTVDGVTSIGLNSLSDTNVTGTSTMQNSFTTAANNSSSSSNNAGLVAATFLAMQDPNFLNVKVKDMVLPWTNKDQTVFFPFNDAAALLIGMIRDGTDFRQALYGNIYYYDPSSSIPSADQFDPYVFDVTNTNPQSNNNHFAYIESQNFPLKTALVKTTQTGVNGTGTGMPLAGVAGVLTTRAMERAYFYAGTNRAMLRFTFLNFLCNDLGQVKDINSNPERVRQDPSRSPGGDSYTFLNQCVGCHAGMDGMDGAFAYYNWGPAIYNSTIDPDTQGSVYAQSNITNGQYDSNGNPEGYVLSGKVFPPSRVMPKFRQNFLSFPGGYETTDDSWINYWRVGADANLGWDEGANDSSPHIVSSNPNDPNGMGSAAQLGYELSHTITFARCQVLHVYRHTCMNDPTESQLESIVSDFQHSNYNMLTVFSDSAIACSNGN